MKLLKSLWGFKTIVGLFQTKMPLYDAWVATVVAAAINSLGMTIQASMLRASPEVSKWPMFSSAMIGVIIIIVLIGKKRQLNFTQISLLFLINTLSVVASLYQTDPIMADIQGVYWMPFQANKLGCLIVGLLAPSFLVGALGILAHVGPSLLLFEQFSLELQGHLAPVEPWALFIFAVSALFILAYRLRIRQTEIEMIQVKANLEYTNHIAHSYLQLRDLMNTPLQSLELSIQILRDRGAEASTVLDQMNTALTRLRNINLVLSKYEDHLKWAAPEEELKPPQLDFVEPDWVSHVAK